VADVAHVLISRDIRQRWRRQKHFDGCARSRSRSPRRQGGRRRFRCWAPQSRLGAERRVHRVRCRRWGCANRADAIRYRLRDHDAVLCAFDLFELYSSDLRRQPLQQRKATLAELLRDVHACALGCEGIAL
jgi:hypothetical protein